MLSSLFTLTNPEIAILRMGIFLMAVLSINLGLINLLPIPMLDGGYIVLFMYELIFKKPLSSSIQIFLLKFGFIFLVSLMLLVTAFDLGF